MYQEHFQKGHINVCILDQDSYVTGYGKHYRVVDTMPQYDEKIGCIAIYCRVDHIHGETMPTIKQIKKVIGKHSSSNGYNHIALSEDYVSGGIARTDLYITKGKNNA